MKPLDKNKKYDLSQLNDKQLQAVLDWLKENDTGWESQQIIAFKGIFRVLKWNGTEWMLGTEYHGTNAIELFNDESDVYKIAHDLIEKGKQHGLKVVVTFEKL